MIKLIIRIITIILRTTPKKIVKGFTFKVLKKYGGTAFSQMLSSASQVAKIASDPKKLIKILQKANKNEINQVLKELELLEKSKFKDKVKELVKETKKSKELAKSENKNLKELKNGIKNNFTKEQDRKYLSSSWLKYGEYKQLGKTGLGTLTIKILQDGKSTWYGPYVYPAIPKLVWDNMKKAKGKNGTGAGSVFWKMFLGLWLPSELKSYIKKHKNQFSNDDLKKTNENIHKLSNQYYNTKQAKNNSYSNIIDNKDYQQHFIKSLKITNELTKATKIKNKDNLQVLKDTIHVYRKSKATSIKVAKNIAFDSFNSFRKVDYSIQNKKSELKRSFNKTTLGKINKKIK